MSFNPTRRTLLRNLAVGTLGASAASTLSLNALASSSSSQPLKLKGNINHSVARWTYGDLSIEELCAVVRHLGFAAIDLVGPRDWPVLKRAGVYSSMCNGAEINLEDGWGDRQFHGRLIDSYRKHIDLVADAGYHNLICFSGNARGMDPETGLENAAWGLKQVLAQAEKRGVILQMELFNSKIDHPDYLCDKSAWGIELCKRLDSPNFKLLYDIYHMQISEGDVIRTIHDHHQHFGHYHTAGVPGRHEIDETQELYYPAIVRAIKETGFDGYIAQEFIPTRMNMEGNIASLASAIQICDI